MYKLDIHWVVPLPSNDAKSVKMQVVTITGRGGTTQDICTPRTQMIHILEDFTHKMEGQTLKKRGQLGSRQLYTTTIKPEQTLLICTVIRSLLVRFLSKVRASDLAGQSSYHFF